MVTLEYPFMDIVTLLPKIRWIYLEYIIWLSRKSRLDSKKHVKYKALAVGSMRWKLGLR